MVKNILIVGIGMVGEQPAPTDGKSKKQSEGTHPEIKKRWLLFFAAMTIIAVIMAAVFVGGNPTQISDPIKGPPQPDLKQPVTGPTATPSPQKGQEKTLTDELPVKVTEWYPIGKGSIFKLEKYYGATISMAVDSSGTLSASLSKQEKLTQAGKYLIMRIKFKVRGNDNNIYETSTIGFGTGPDTQMLPSGGWTALLNDKQFIEIVKKSNPLWQEKNLLWQPEFGIKDAKRPEEAKVVVIK